MDPCPSCGSTIFEGDLFCRSCGAAVSLLDEKADYGRILVLSSGVILLGLHLFSILFTLTVASITSQVASVDYLGTFVTGGIEVVLLYLIYRGHSWARWLVGLLSALATLIGLLFLPQMLRSPAATASILILIVGMAAIALILLLSPSVRSFQRAQKRRYSQKRKSAA